MANEDLELRLEESVRRALRQCSRQDVSIPADVQIILDDGSCFTSGTAMVRNISLRGALLGRLVLKKQALPATRFQIRIDFRTPEYKGIGALCRPVRLGMTSGFELAVEFDDFWARADERKKTTIIRKPKKSRATRRRKKKK